MGDVNIQSVRSPLGTGGNLAKLPNLCQMIANSKYKFRHEKTKCTVEVSNTIKQNIQKYGKRNQEAKWAAIEKADHIASSWTRKK